MTGFVEYGWSGTGRGLVGSVGIDWGWVVGWVSRRLRE